MPRRYLSSGGTNPATAATVDACQFNLWNPSADRICNLIQVSLSLESIAAVDIGLVRTSTIGAGYAFQNLHAVNSYDFDGDVQPVLNSYHGPFATTNPVVQPPYLFRAANLSVTGAPGFTRVWEFESEPLQIPPGSGIGVCTPTGVAIPPVWIGYIWEEDTS